MTKKEPEIQRSREQDIIEGLKVVCKCRNIRKSVLLKHIRAGITTVEGLKKATGAGSGTCKGKECIGKIEELLRETGSKSSKGS